MCSSMSDGEERRCNERMEAETRRRMGGVLFGGSQPAEHQGRVIAREGGVLHSQIDGAVQQNFAIKIRSTSSTIVMLCRLNG